MERCDGFGASIGRLALVEYVVVGYLLRTCWSSFDRLDDMEGYSLQSFIIMIYGGA